MTEIKVTGAESLIMALLWEGAPQTADQLVRALRPSRGWSDTTVKTLLGRLVAKGAITAVPDGRRYLYSPALQRADYVAAESDNLLGRLFAGELAPLVLNFAERHKITPRDAARIRELLDRLEEEDG
ncbi:MAG: CopY/TcrY family transcriptional repressor [Caulobacteraceae bacterium]|nr:CopY/TcrY family transcriptional repressor [Caulobacteraceae bacterium]